MKQLSHFLIITVLIFSSCGKKDEKKELEEFPVVEIPQKNITGYQRFPAHIEGTLRSDQKLMGFLKRFM